MPAASATGRSGLFSRSIEIVSNFATLVVMVLLSVVLVKNHLLPSQPLFPSQPLPLQARSPSVRPTDLVTVGTNLSKRIPGVNWSKNGRTLVLVLSTQCHFCTESAPFFRQLKERIGNSVKMVGVLPQSVAESQAYLGGEGVHLDDIRQVSLDQTGVAGTPTLLLVNSNGAVMQTWVGKPAPDKQQEILKVIGAVRAKKSEAAL